MHVQAIKVLFTARLSDVANCSHNFWILKL